MLGHKQQKKTNQSLKYYGSQDGYADMKNNLDVDKIQRKQIRSGSRLYYT